MNVCVCCVCTPPSTALCTTAMGWDGKSLSFVMINKKRKKIK